MKQWVNTLLDIIFPPSKECPLCGNPYEGEYCNSCLKELPGPRFPHCTICGRFFEHDIGHGERLCTFCYQKRPPFVLARSVGVYDGRLKEAIYLFKYTGRQTLAGLLARLMIELIVMEEAYLPIDVVVPVPVHEQKLWERSFNQAELLALEIGKELGVYGDTKCLKRVRYTPNLSKLRPSERQTALRGAFQVKDTSLAGKKVLLVDDIFTSGITVEECTETLLRAGVAEVYVVTLAAGIV